MRTWKTRHEAKAGDLILMPNGTVRELLKSELEEAVLDHEYETAKVVTADMKQAYRDRTKCRAVGCDANSPKNRDK